MKSIGGKAGFQEGEKGVPTSGRGPVRPRRGCSGSQEEGQRKAGQGQPEQPEASRKPLKDFGQGSSTPSDLMEMFFGDDSPPCSSAYEQGATGGGCRGAALAATQVRNEGGQGGPSQRHPGLRFGGAAGSGQAGGVGQGWGAEPLPTLSAAPSLQGHPGHLGCTRVCTLGHVQRLPRPSWKGTDGSGQRVNDDNRGWNKVHCPNS